MFGQLKRKKGMDVLLEAILALEDKALVHLLLIGEMNDEVLSTLQEKNIAYAHYSFMDRYELIQYYLCCDAVVIPSHYDGMPNVLLEAGALGIPVLGSRIDGIKDVMSPVCDELLFEPGNEKQCRLVLSKFMNAKDEERKKWSASLKNRIESTYTSQQETNAYEKIIHTLLGNSERTLRLQPR